MPIHLNNSSIIGVLVFAIIPKALIIIKPYGKSAVKYLEFKSGAYFPFSNIDGVVSPLNPLIDLILFVKLIASCDS